VLSGILSFVIFTEILWCCQYHDWDP